MDARTNQGGGVLDSSPSIPPTPKRKPSTLLTVCPFILGNEFCERLAFYGLSTNLIIYLTRVMGYDSGFAAVQVSLFEGSCYLSPLLGAWLADSLWGRYRTILVFSFIYLLGMVALTASAAVPGLTPPPDRYPTALQSAALYTSLYIVALGTGGIKPNVSAFGADQFDEADPADRREKTSFFNWFYFSINLGSLLAVTLIVWIQENLSWAVGFAIPAACMAAAIFVFVAGSGRYTHVAPSESPFSRVLKVIWAALRARRDAATRRSFQLPDMEEPGENGSTRRATTVTFAPLPGDADAELDDDEVSEALLFDGYTGAAERRNGPPNGVRRTESLLWLDAAVVARAPGGARRFTRRQVEEVKLVVRMLPIFFATILYWTIYIQMGSFFVVQGAHMDRRVDIVVPWPNTSAGGDHGPPSGGTSGGDVNPEVARDSSSNLTFTFTIPAASLSMINTLAIVALIPMYDKLLVPALRRAGRPMTLLKRIGWGLVVCIAAMVAAALVEQKRLQLYRDGDIISDHSKDSTLGAVVDMSVWWQAPQYLLIGLSEVFTSIGQLEFFYDQAPDVMRSCSMALQLLSVCIGSYLSGAVVWATQALTSRLDLDGQGWLPKDLNHGRLDSFFLFLGGLMVINLVLFIVVALNYEYKAVEHKRTAAPRRVGLPPPPPRPERRPPSAPVPSVRPSAAHPAARAATGAESPATPAFYGRSVTYLPQTPALPAPFR